MLHMHAFARVSEFARACGKRGSIVAEKFVNLNVSLFVRKRNICCGRSKRIQKHFASATNVSEMFLGLRSKEAKHLFGFQLVCSPQKH